MTALAFRRDFQPEYGMAVRVAPGVRRLSARNPGPFTFRGTNTYLIGEGPVVVVDPGPEDADHHAALLAAIGDAGVARILVTHTHRDHSGGVAALSLATGAPTAGGGRHRPARPLGAGEVNLLDTAADTGFVPDLVLGDGAAIDAGGIGMVAIATPGHTANHLAFALPDLGLLLTGDHVMGWSTSIVAPPDGSMADYMASLDRVLAQPEDRYLPGHGGPIDDAHGWVAALKQHRLDRQRAILARLAAGDTTIPAIVAAVYAGLDPALGAGAALSVLAHLEELIERGAVATDGAAGLAGVFRLA
ncbi:MAG TPA: MBL fold metallo-hydrolase [Bauldia sp.]|nr:MBL fold metallo-hydrolase [Bauldia sp.]